MSYFDVFVIPVPKNKLAEYRKLAELSATVWREAGALDYVEFQGDDVKPGKLTSFPQSLDLKPDELVVVALITTRSREHRDEVNAKAMADPRMAGMDAKTIPFDARRMFWGGFKPFVGGQSAIQPYLFFRGRCAEAVDYYKRVLGAEVVMLARFKDSPEKLDPGLVPPELADRVMHASLRIAGSEIMMSDGLKSGPLDFQCMSLSLSLPSETGVDRIFNALAADGTVQMPLSKTFFSPRFGAVSDKFGVSWMLIVTQATD